MTLIPVALGALVIVALTYMAIQAAKRREAEYNAAWALAAAELQGSFRPKTRKEPRTIQATVDGTAVLIDTYVVSNGKTSHTYTRARATITRPIRGLELRREGLSSMMGKVVRGADIELGDPEFDDAVLLRAEDESAARGTMDAATRERTLAGLRRELTVKGETVTWKKGGFVADPKELARRAREVAELATSLRAPAHTGRALRDVGAHDPDPGVRRQTLSYAAAHAPEFARAMATDMLEDPVPELRARAAAHSGPTGVPVAHELAVDPSMPDAVRALAIPTAAPALTDDELVELLGRVGAIAAAAATAVARAKRHALAPHLPPLLTRSDPEAIAAADALGAVGGPEHESELALALGAGSVDVQRAAARALGRIGTVRSVPALTPHTQGLLTDSLLKSDARAAIASIQHRAGGTRGGLAVIGGAGGELAVAKERGGLSVEPVASSSARPVGVPLARVPRPSGE